VLRNNSEKLRTAAIRPHLVWGPGDTNLIPRLMDRGREQSLRIVGDGKNQVDIAYIDNVVHAHLLAAKNLAGVGTAGGHAFFIGQQEPVQLWPWINELFAKVEVPPVTSQVGLRIAKAGGWMLEKGHGLLGSKQEPRMTRFLAEQLAMSHWFSKEKAETLLGYREKVSTEVGMKRLIDWLRQEGL
jgi:nucleoside-diphosphate-sugar epimerase